MSIRAVIFDLGGVLIRTDNREPRSKLAERFGMTYEQLDTLVFSGDTAERAYTGGYPIRGHWDWVAQQLHLTPEELAEFEKEFWAGDSLDSKLVEFIRSLRTRVKTGVLSNAWEDTREALRGKWGILDLFDEVAISAEIGLKKPDPRVYEVITSRMGVKPEEAVFLDDMPENVEAARKAGLKAVRFVNADQAIREIEAMLEE